MEIHEIIAIIPTFFDSQTYSTLIPEPITIQSHLGELAALMTSICWAITALSFEAAGKRVGSLSVNFIRLALGFVFISLFTLAYRGLLLPTDAPAKAWIWLSVSGIIGFTLGDLFLFQAFVVVGARISMLMMALAPPITAAIGWLFLHETLSRQDLLGMALTVAGIALVTLERNPGPKLVKLAHPVSGILFAFGGALGQAIGLIFSKFGMGDYNPFAATQIRIMAGILGFVPLFFVIRGWDRMRSALRNRGAMARISLGSFFGPFLGVSLSLLAIQNTATGIASTIMAIVPLLIIPPAILLFKEKVTLKEGIGALVAVGGVALFFI